jgi:uncharacterized integral membrane protein
MKTKQINWFALIGGILILLLLPISIYFSWWQLTIGKNLLTINVSPVNTNITLIGTQFSAPLIWAMNLTGSLTFLASGIIMLIYALIPAKPYSKDLLNFAYRKPLYIVILYLAGLLVMTFAAQAFLGQGIPITGSANLTLPSSMTMGANISILVTSAFQWPFYLAIIAAGLNITARVYHTKLTKTLKQTSQEPITLQTIPTVEKEMETPIPNQTQQN